MNDGNHHRIESELNCLMMKHSIIQKCACITNKCDIIKEKKPFERRHRANCTYYDAAT